MVLWLESRKDEGDRVGGGAEVPMGDDDREDEDGLESDGSEVGAGALHNSVVECGSCRPCWFCC